MLNNEAFYTNEQFTVMTDSVILKLQLQPNSKIFNLKHIVSDTTLLVI